MGIEDGTTSARLDSTIDALVEITRRRREGDLEPYDPEEIIGEDPVEAPVDLLLDRDEMEERGGRLDQLKDLARKHKKRVFIISAFAGVTTAVVASLWMIKRLRDENPKADITDEL